MRQDDRDTDRDAGFLQEAEQEQVAGREPRPTEDGVVRDRQAAQLRERLRDAEDNVSDRSDEPDS